MEAVVVGVEVLWVVVCSEVDSAVVVASVDAGAVVVSASVVSTEDVVSASVVSVVFSVVSSSLVVFALLFFVVVSSAVVESSSSSSSALLRNSPCALPVHSRVNQLALTAASSSAHPLALKHACIRSCWSMGESVRRHSVNSLGLPQDD